MLSLLWIFTAKLVDRVYQQSIETISLSDGLTMLFHDDLASLDYQLSGKGIHQSPRFTSEDDRLLPRLVCEKNGEKQRILKQAVENERDCCEMLFRKSNEQIYSRSTVSTRNSRRNNQCNAKEKRKLYECTSEEVKVNTNLGLYQINPIVLTLSPDKIVATWNSYESTNSIKGRLFDLNLNSLGDEFQINDDFYPSYGTPHRAELLSNGYYVVVWATNAVDLVFVIMNDSSVVKYEEILNTSSAIYNYNMDICSSVNEGFLVVWNRSQTTENDIQGRFFDSSGIAQGDEFVIYSLDDSSPSLPRCSSLANGNFVVAWNDFGSDGDQYGIVALIIDSSGTAIGEAIPVNTSTENNQTNCSVATLIDGNFVISWRSVIPNGSILFIVYGQLFDSAGNTIGEEFQVNPDGDDDVLSLYVEPLFDGGFLITWSRNLYDGNEQGVYAQRYDASASAVDDTFLINIETEGDQAYSNSAAIYNGFIVAWHSDKLNGDAMEIIARGFYDSNTIENSGECETCLSYQYADSNSCLDCREECSSCENGTECLACSHTEASPPYCCNQNASISGDSCSVVTVSQYSSGTECMDCEEGCGTCDSLGCLTCIISGIDCCSLPRVLQSDMISCDCPSECSTCDSAGCLSCSSGQDCCPSSRYFDSDSNTCEDCGTSDDEGCLSCQLGVLTCCPEGRFFDSTTETCEDCISPCETCNSSAECSSCESGSTCCGDGRYSDSDSVCQDCLSDCATCSDGSSCDICRDPDYTAPECCPDSTQDDANKDGFCECLDGTTVLSHCLCQSNEAWYWDETDYSCIGPFSIYSLTIDGLSEIDSSCSEDLELVVRDFSDLQINDPDSFKIRWFSDSSALAEYLRGQVSNPLSVPSTYLSVGTTTFSVYMSAYGVVLSGTHSVTKSDDVPLTISLSSECLTILSSDDTVEVTPTVSSRPCPSVTYSWTLVSSSPLQTPGSSSETLLIPPNTLPTNEFTYYIFSAFSGPALISETLIFYVTNPDLVAVIDSVGPDVPSTEDLSLNGGNSSDPSDDSGGLSFVWSCVEIGSGVCPSFSDTTNSQMIISSSELSAGMSFVMILTVYKDTQTDSASVHLSVI